MSPLANIIHLFLRAWVITVVLETLVLFAAVFLWLRKERERQQWSFGLLLFCGIAASALTHPYLNLVLPLYIRGSYTLFLIVGETLVILAETVFYRFVLRLDWRRSLALSAVCNAVSASAGLLFFIE